jgi:hypothetical protein
VCTCAMPSLSKANRPSCLHIIEPNMRRVSHRVTSTTDQGGCYRLCSSDISHRHPTMRCPTHGDQEAMVGRLDSPCSNGNISHIVALAIANT